MLLYAFISNYIHKYYILGSPTGYYPNKGGEQNTMTKQKYGVCEEYGICSMCQKVGRVVDQYGRSGYVSIPIPLGGLDVGEEEN